MKEPLKKATLCFLIKDNQVLLAMKKRGFGVGKYNGVGGKKTPDEMIEDTAKRETYEEIGVTVKEMEKVAVLDFYCPQNPELDQQVTVFLVNDWEGEPTESEEMAPKWFSKSDIPFEKMWSDDNFWLPLVLDNKKLKGEFSFTESGETIDYNIIEIQ